MGRIWLDGKESPDEPKVLRAHVDKLLVMLLQPGTDPPSGECVDAAARKVWNMLTRRGRDVLTRQLRGLGYSGRQPYNSLLNYARAEIPDLMSQHKRPKPSVVSALMVTEPPGGTYERRAEEQIRKLTFNFDTRDWEASGVLSAMGYHVGAKGPDSPTRRAILTETLKVTLVAASPEFAQYVSEWGLPMSRQRLTKIRNSISSFARNASFKRADYSGAISDWKSDLAWLEAIYGP